LIGAGLPSTGALSRKAAAEMLGLAPCYHMVHLLGDLNEVQPESMESAMAHFNEEVQQMVPSDHLRVWSLSDGWEPLCRFLDRAVSDTPLPHLKDSKELAHRIVDGSLLALQEWWARDAPAIAAT
jgi:hypothetical protein